MQVRKLQGNYFIAYSLQTTCNHNKKRLNEHLEDEMVEEQCGFRKGRSCTDAIFTAQQIIEKRKEHNLPLFLLFIDYEKAYDNVNRDKPWEMMENKIPNYLLTVRYIIMKFKITKSKGKIPVAIIFLVTKCTC